MKCFNCHKRINIETSFNAGDEFVCKSCYEWYNKKIGELKE